MEKTFGSTKIGDKIYMVSISSSKIEENKEGEIIRTLTVQDISTLGDFYTFMFTLSDGSHIKVNRNNVIATAEKTPEERLQHPMALFEDIYSHSRKKLLETVSWRLDEHVKRMTALKEECLKLSNKSIVSKRIIDELCKTYYSEPEEEEREITEVEFAEMAL